MVIREKHALWLRIVHWANVPLMLLMMWSGLLIYWANDVYPGFFPPWFYRAFAIPQRLAEGLGIHFFIGWFFVLNASAYLAGTLATGHWRELVPSLARRPREKFSLAQKFAYSGVTGLGLLEIWSGFAIYKPVQLSFLLAPFGGYERARIVHFGAMVLLALFIVVHVIQVARAGWNNFRGMVAGFEAEDA